MSDGQELELAKIVIVRVLDDDDDYVSYRLSTGMTIIEALGMIELAKLQIVEALYEGNLRTATGDMEGEVHLTDEEDEEEDGDS